MAIAAGDHVLVRGEHWIVDEAASFAGVTLLSLSGVEPARTNLRCQLLAPFDRPTVLPRDRRIRTVSKRQWAAQLRSRVAGVRVWGELRAAQHAAIDLLPFQLEPALALIQGRAVRFLLADEVGLGKTIQAGLMLAELQHRGWCDRALIVVPAGLRRQWAEELRCRFNIQATIMDAAAVSSLAAALPPDVNPWTVEPIVITSIDFVKQPEVRHALAHVVWDLMIVDEAHQAATPSHRRDAVSDLGRRSRHVVLLTATPHTGDDDRYRALCALGQSEPRETLLLFRRTREHAGVPRTRRAHLLPVSLTPHAADMHRHLEAYATRLWTIAESSGRREPQLVAMVLSKRGFSCAASLARSVERRLAGLDDSPVLPAQPELPFVDDDGADDAVLPAGPMFDRPDEERTALEDLLESARRAARDDRKMAALSRILRRVREPIIVFTEYRDTLDAVAAAAGAQRTVALLHGGQTAEERRRATASFTTGKSDLLIATDAGSEGLNLQAACRIVVNLELPWNPIRLEQRIGRVDRIGQTRSVHAINLFAKGTAEATVLATLAKKLGRIAASEIDVAACVLSRSQSVATGAIKDSTGSTLELRQSAIAEARRMSERREQSRATVDHLCLLGANVVFVCAIAAMPTSATALVRVRLVTCGGRLVEDTLLPLRMAISPHSCRKRADVGRLAAIFIRESAPALIQTARHFAEARAAAVARASGPALDQLRRREQAIAAAAAATTESFVQPSMFESRTIRARDEALRQANEMSAATRTRDERLSSDRTVVLAHAPEIELLLFTC